MWDPPSGAAPAYEYELQEDGVASFDHALLRYRGPQTRSFVSGLPEGPRFFRVRSRAHEGAEWSAWSETVTIVVEPHGLALAWTLFGIGAFLVTAIVGFLLVADRRVRASEREMFASGVEHAG